MEFIAFIGKGGVLMYPLILCSIVSIWVFIEKIITLKRRRVIKPEIVDVIENISNCKDIPLALSICEKNQGVFSNIVKVGLSNIELPHSELKQELENQGRQEIRKLERGMVILETIAAITPILGLLGTVIGMIKVFNVIALEGVGSASVLSGGISEALITTASGLSIGIPTLVFYNYFTQKAENLILDMEKISNEFLKKLKGFQNEECSNETA